MAEELPQGGFQSIDLPIDDTIKPNNKLLCQMLKKLLSKKLHENDT